MKKILFIPIDNRPITYSLTKQIADVHKSLELHMPERKFLGGLVESANTDEILSFLKNSKEEDLIILSLDTIAYGGLVPSRRTTETCDEIKSRIDFLKEILIEKKQNNPDLKIYATSSIMRISNNNVNEEEKEYWANWGKRIFSYSYHQHKSRKLKEYNCVHNIIPAEILDDYLSTRKRNFEINKLYLNFLKTGVFDFMVYSKDDTGEFGLNVEEAEFLEEEIKKENLSAIVKTGADEIPLGLLLKGVTDGISVKIKPVYANLNSIDKISRYEDISVESCTKAQIEIGLSGASVVDDNPDIILYINNFEFSQGDLVFQDVINSSNKILEFETPYIVADINNANGADNGLVSCMLDKKMEDNFLGYSGYNTSANTIGSALALGVITYLAKKEDKFDKKAFNKLMAVRLLDDWGYQANVRKEVQSVPDKKFEEALVNNESAFKPFEEAVNKYLNEDFKTKYSLPWKRSFEIEIEVENGN